MKLSSPLLLCLLYEPFDVRICECLLKTDTLAYLTPIDEILAPVKKSY